MASLERFLEPPRLRTLEADEDRRATWLELFLDLVFVAAIAQVAATLSADPTAAGFGRYLVLFLPIGWAWAGFTFYATRFDTDDLVYRLLTLLGMFAIAGRPRVRRRAPDPDPALRCAPPTSGTRASCPGRSSCR
ncbi:MAG TPA: low temperature requirement protein A, partial [Gaiellaceae bacterium]|nr:low temperature requirement protein A [Gaiellaceae bacterium]